MLFCKKHIILFLVICIVFAFITAPLLSEFRVLSPKNTDTLITGRDVIFLLDGEIEYYAGIFISYDGGISWDNLAQGINVQKAKWIMPWPESLNIKFKIINQYTIPPHLNYELSGAHSSEIRSVKFAPNDSLFLTCSAKPELKSWKLGEMLPRTSVNLESFINIAYDAEYFSSSDSVIIAGDGSVLLVLPNSGVIRKFADDSIKNIVRAVASNPVSGVFAAASNTGPGIDDGIVSLYDIETGQRIADFRAESLSQIRDVSFSADGKLLCFGAYNGIIYVYDWQSGILKAKFSGHGDNGKSSLVYSCNFDPITGLIVSGGGDQTVRLWSSMPPEMTKVLVKHHSQVWETVFHPLRNWILSASLDSMLIQWDVQSGAILHPPLLHGGEVLTADYSSDGSYFVSGGRDNSVRIWKNFEFISDTVIISPVVKYPADLKLTNIAGYSGDVRGLQLSLEISDSVPEVKRKGLEIDYEVEYPSLLIDIHDNSLNGELTLPYDTLAGRALVHAGNNILLNKTIKLLLSEKLFDSTRIAGYKLNSDDFLVSRSNGLVTILRECIGDNGRSFYMGNNVSALLSPNPAKELVRLALSMPETGSAVVSIHDITGKVVKSLGVVIDKNLEKQLNIDLNELQNGNYYIFIQSNNMILSRHLKIFR